MNVHAKFLMMCAVGNMSMPASPVAAAADSVIATYTAQYQLKYKGRKAGSSEFVVNYDEPSGLYSFSSRSQAKGLLRMVSPKPVLEHSEFKVIDGNILPVEFWYEDGSRKGEDNYHTSFDWDANVAVIEGKDGQRELDLEIGVLDRSTIQVALMTDLAAGRVPGPYVLADEESLRTYEYTAQDSAAISTPLGDYTALRFVQQRQGSSRSTLLWVVPELHFLPVLIQQFRDNEVRSEFILQSVTF